MELSGTEAVDSLKAALAETHRKMEFYKKALLNANKQLVRLNLTNKRNQGKNVNTNSKELSKLSVGENGNKNPLEILPKEMWDSVFDWLLDWKDLKNCYNTCHQFQINLQNTKTLWLFHKILPYIRGQLEPQDVLKCRGVCKAWKLQIDCYFPQPILFCFSGDSWIHKLECMMQHGKNPLVGGLVKIRPPPNMEHSIDQEGSNVLSFDWDDIEISASVEQPNVLMGVNGNVGDSAEDGIKVVDAGRNDAEVVGADQIDTEVVHVVRIDAEFVDADRIDAEVVDADRIDAEFVADANENSVKVAPDVDEAEQIDDIDSNVVELASENNQNDVKLATEINRNDEELTHAAGSNEVKFVTSGVCSLLKASDVNTEIDKAEPVSAEVISKEIADVNEDNGFSESTACLILKSFNENNFEGSVDFSDGSDRFENAWILMTFDKGVNRLINGIGQHITCIDIDIPDCMSASEINDLVPWLLTKCQRLKRFIIYGGGDDWSEFQEDPREDPSFNGKVPEDFHMPCSLESLDMSLNTLGSWPLQTWLLEDCSWKLRQFSTNEWSIRTDLDYSDLTWENLRELEIRDVEKFLEDDEYLVNTYQALLNMEAFYFCCLEKLTLKSHGSFEDLLQVVNHFPSLQHLKLPLGGYSDDKTVKTNKGLVALEHLKTLEFPVSGSCNFLIYFPYLENLILSVQTGEDKIHQKEKNEIVELSPYWLHKKKIYESNVWELLPFLKTLQVSTKTKYQNFQQSTPDYCVRFTRIEYRESKTETLDKP